MKQIKRAGRATMGVRLMDLREGEIVASVARTAAKQLKEAGVEEE
jgi:DNA gyrase/topoisomerase IV subunit A